MTDAPATVSPEDSLRTVDNLMLLVEARHVPVVRDGRLVGLISERDLFAAELCPAERCGRDSDPMEHWTAETLMQRIVVSAKPKDDVRHAAHLLLRHRISALPVVHDGQLVGILSTVDLMRWAKQAFEADGRRATARDLMGTEAVVTATPADSLDLAETVMQCGAFRHLPVVESGRLVGMISDRDVLAACRSTLEACEPGERRRHKTRVQVGEVMTAHPKIVLPEALAADVAAALSTGEVGALPVVEDGKLIGIVTTTDILRYVAGHTSAGQDEDGRYVA